MDEVCRGELLKENKGENMEDPEPLPRCVVLGYGQGVFNGLLLLVRGSNSLNRFLG